MSLVIDADISNDVDLLGKTVNDLQSSIAIGDSAITGTLKYVSDYTGFDGSHPELQVGNFIALHASVPGHDDATITVKVTNQVTLDPTDNICVLRIADKATQTITFTASLDGYQTVTKRFTLTGLTCEEAPAG